MTKGLRVLADVAERDVPGIVAYHLPRSRAKAESILAEYDQIIRLLSENPTLFRLRAHGWHVYVFRSAAYVLYYREMPEYWLIAGIFHAHRDPDWIQAQLLIRESRESGAP